MAVKVKDVTASATKFVTRAQAAGGDYKNGVATAGQRWHDQTKASNDAWKAGVSDAAGRNAFSNGVDKAGPNKYQDNASGKGALRYPQGVAQAGPTWQANTAPYLAVISALNLPIRQAKGNPGNYQRVQAIGDALRAARLRGAH
jgi:hypothetical protein